MTIRKTYFYKNMPYMNFSFLFKTVRFLIFFFLFFSPQIFSQYTVLPKPGTQFGVVSSSAEGPGLPSNHSYVYLGDKDTIMCGKKYKHFYNDMWVRNENGRAYLQTSMGCYNPEVFVYDMSLNTGDTFPPAPTDTFYSIVDSAYYAPILNNEMRKHIRFRRGNGPFWIDGIGHPEVGFIPRATFADRYLICVKDSSNQLLFDAKSGWANLFPCDGLLSAFSGIHNNARDQIPFTLYPNPSKDFVYLKTNMNFLYKELLIYVHDVSGKRVMEKNINDINSQEKINLSDLGSGLYFLSLYNKGEHLGTVKVVKKD